MTVRKRMEHLARSIAENAGKIDEASVRGLVKELDRAKRVFLCGAGRSGYVARAFAMRLMHLGFEVHVAGEATTPAIKKGDLLVAVTGSGETNSVVSMAQAAKRMGARVASVTSNPGSPAGALSDAVVVIRGRAPGRREKDWLARQLRGGHEPLAPLGTLFELSAMVFLDSLVEELMVLRKESEEDMKKRHTQLE
jgi:6-phospho 3-hexuloisomerase